ncbi:unnamed protein product [Ostreobium quekettii]|uniref:Rhodanese domain-containing protein n=1 Tax=Ostreobium quekettii TaxID=121088 RepID=A0A8S1IR78_9CHLO|nr:unnamed protein product [Ostreobium quekettii]
MEKTVLNLAFYKFCDLAPVHSLKIELEKLCETHGIMGSLILGYEGINGMLAGEKDNAEAFLADMRALRPAFAEMPIKRSWSENVPFQRMIIKVKPEIVTMRVDDVDAVAKTGNHLPPEQFRDWLRAGEDMVLIDVRNHFEYKLGTFKGALDPETTAFHEFPDVVRTHDTDWKDKKVVMFCTGGIRCEKATSWMLDEGFEDIYQLEGGVLAYFEKVPDAEKDWDGELFVFDERVALNTRLEETDTTLEDIESS